MKFEDIGLNKEILDRLADYGVFIKNKAPPLNKGKALILLGEAMLEKFNREFIDLWKNELFPDCLLKDYEASEQEVHEWIHGGDPQPDCKSCSNDCKEVNDKMDVETKKLLNNYLELYTEIFKKVDNETAATAIMTEICKDKRVEQMKKERETKSNNDEVTLRQKKCMERLGIDCPENTTRQEASLLIQEEIGRLNGNGE